MMYQCVLFGLFFFMNELSNFEDFVYVKYTYTLYIFCIVNTPLLVVQWT